MLPVIVRPRAQIGSGPPAPGSPEPDGYLDLTVVEQKELQWSRIPRREMLLDTAKIARATGFGRPFISAIKAQPDSPFSGRYSTVAKVEAWIVAHPDFRSSHHWQERRLQRAQEHSLSARVVDKFYAPSRRRAQ